MIFGKGAVSAHCGVLDVGTPLPGTYRAPAAWAGMGLLDADLQSFSEAAETAEVAFFTSPVAPPATEKWNDPLEFALEFLRFPGRAGR